MTLEHIKGEISGSWDQMQENTPHLQQTAETIRDAYLTVNPEGSVQGESLSQALGHLYEAYHVLCDLIPALPEYRARLEAYLARFSNTPLSVSASFVQGALPGTDRLLVATFNTLADSYTAYGDYRHAPTDLMRPGARIEALIRLIGDLDADVVGLQEVEEPLAERLDHSGWQTFWSQKEDAPDGCLTLVRGDLAVDSFETLYFGDGSGHVAQIIKIGGIAISNTHIKWEMQNRIAQVQELLAKTAAEPHAVLMGDFNDRPGEPARRLVAEAGFRNLLRDDAPTAYIANREGAASIDLFAVRGLQAELAPAQLGKGFDIREIPSNRCPSDHIPILAQVALPKTIVE